MRFVLIIILATAVNGCGIDGAPTPKSLELID